MGSFLWCLFMQSRFLWGKFVWGWTLWGKPQGGRRLQSKVYFCFCNIYAYNFSLTILTSPNLTGEPSSSALYVILTLFFLMTQGNSYYQHLFQNIWSSSKDRVILWQGGVSRLHLSHLGGTGERTGRTRTNRSHCLELGEKEQKLELVGSCTWKRARMEKRTKK